MAEELQEDNRIIIKQLVKFHELFYLHLLGVGCRLREAPLEVGDVTI
jgi:hypothetical protein